MSERPTPDPSDNATLTEVLAAYTDAGFGGSFSAATSGALECHSCGAHVPAGEVAMSSLRRMEGASDPADMVAVVALTCPRCAARGTAVLGLRPAASAEDSDGLSELRDRRSDDVAPANSAPGQAVRD